MAIDYSDGVIAAHKDVNPELLKYAAANNIPLLEYPGEDFHSAYEEFYEKI
jgi:starch synthase